MRVPIKTPQEVEKMADAGKILAEIVAKMWEFTKAGVTTQDIDAYANELCKENNVLPAFLGVKAGKYRYPAIACLSVNEVVVHGVPNNTPLRETDLLAIDMGVIKDGWYSDMCVPGFVGGKVYETKNESELSDKQRVLRAANAALAAAIEMCKPGNRLKDVCLAIRDKAREFECRPMLEFVGHGIGRKLHEDPQIPGYWMEQVYHDFVLEKGMVFAIESILTSGKAVEAKVSREDHWSAWPKDKAMTAVAEHTVAIGEEPRILTA
jgi:methionyl aminopeptidase